jgi:hypothetical protein
MAGGIGSRSSPGIDFSEPTRSQPIFLADVIGFLVAAAGLNPNFRIMARELLTHELTGGDRRTPSGAAASPERPGRLALMPEGAQPPSRSDATPSSMD